MARNMASTFLAGAAALMTLQKLLEVLGQDFRSGFEGAV